MNFGIFFQEIFLPTVRLCIDFMRWLLIMYMGGIEAGRLIERNSESNLDIWIAK